MSTTRKHNGTIGSVSFSAKSEAFIVKCKDSQSIFVSQSLMKSMAMAQGLTLNAMLRSLTNAKVSCAITSVKAGEPVLDRNQLPVLENGQQRFYTKDHDRHSEITIEIPQSRLQSLDMAEEFGQAMAANFVLPNPLSLQTNSKPLEIAAKPETTFIPVPEPNLEKTVFEFERSATN